jgi:hypothetical protein
MSQGWEKSQIHTKFWYMIFMGKDRTECGQACGVGYWIQEASAMEPVVHSHEHGNKILITKANKMHYSSNLFLRKHSTCFEQIYCPSPGVSTLFTQQQIFVMLVMLPVS